jgi:hypothetical protein
LQVKKYFGAKMQKLFFRLMPVFIGLLVLGCAQSGTVAPYVLANGYTTTADETAKLNALLPQVESLNAKAKECPSSRGAFSEQESQAIIDSYTALLKSEFGENYKKFFLCRTASVTLDAMTNDVVSEQAAQFVDPDTISSSASLSKAFSTVPFDLGNGYQIVCGAIQWI